MVVKIIVKIENIESSKIYILRENPIIDKRKEDALKRSSLKENL